MRVLPLIMVPTFFASEGFFTCYFTLLYFTSGPGSFCWPHPSMGVPPLIMVPAHIASGLFYFTDGPGAHVGVTFHEGPTIDYGANKFWF
ncbi:hypothetical protein F4604DRAFT_1815255, partial [Suillus subluteus]